MERMEIKVDTRKRDCRYFDKVNYTISDNNNIIRLVNKDGSSPFNVVIDILASSLNLNEQEKNVLYIINYYDNIKDINSILEIYKINYNRSRSTFNRAIETLERKKVIKVNSNGFIEVNELYTINAHNTGNIKVIVVELYPKDINGDGRGA